MVWREWIGFSVGVLTLAVIIVVSIFFSIEVSREAARNTKADAEMRAWIAEQIADLQRGGEKREYDIDRLEQGEAARASKLEQLRKDVVREKSRAKSVTIVLPSMVATPTPGMSRVPTPKSTRPAKRK